MRPQRRQPTRLPCPWDSPGKNTGVGCHFLLQCMKVKSESEVTQSCSTLATPWTAAYQAPPSMGFSRQKYWSGVPLPSPYQIIQSVKVLLLFIIINITIIFTLNHLLASFCVVYVIYESSSDDSLSLRGVSFSLAFCMPFSPLRACYIV